MRQEKMLLSAAAAAFLTTMVLTACKKNNDNEIPKPPVEAKTVRIQTVHASPKTADIEIKVGDVKLPEKVTFLSQSSSYTTLTTKGDLTIQVLAGGAVVGQGTHKLDNKFKYTLFVYDTLGVNKTLKYFLMQDTFPAPASGSANIRFLHLAPQTGTVDVDVFRGTDSLRLISQIAYAGSKVPDAKFAAIKSGEYRVKVKSKTGSVTSVILDVPSVKIESGKSVSLYLKGLTKGTGDNKLGLQLVQHK